MALWFGDTKRGRIGRFFGNDPTLKGYWQLNGNARDNSGNGLDGTVTGAVLSVIGRIFNLGYILNGSTATIDMADTGLPSGNPTITIMVWASPAAVQNGILFGYGSPGLPNYRAWNFGLGNFPPKVLYLDTYGEAFSTPYDYPIDKFALYTFVYSPSTGKFYVDGKFIGSASPLNTPNVTLINGAIGRRRSNNDSYFNGKIAEVAVFSREILAQEIDRYYRWAISAKPLWIRVLVAAAVFVRSASVSVSNAASRLATATRAMTFKRTITTSVSNAAGRLATITSNYITKIKNLITNVFKWNFSTWS